MLLLTLVPSICALSVVPDLPLTGLDQPAGQNEEAEQPEASEGTPLQALLPPQPVEKQEDSGLSRNWSVGLVSAGVATVGLSIGAVSWWIDTGTAPFGLKETGFFQRWTYAGGGDKAGHAYACYLATIAMTHLYELVGVPRRTATLLAAGFTLTVSNGVEIIDGFTPHQFEYGDVVMNLLGIGLGTAAMLVPSLHDVVGLRLAWWPSPRFIQGKKSYITFVNDYSGQLFYLDLKLKGIFEHAGMDPGPARFLLAGLNFNSFEYSPGGAPREARQRNFGVHVSLSLPELMEAFLPEHSARNVPANFLRYFSPPFFTIALVRDFNHGHYFLNFGLANRCQVPL